MKKHNRFIQLIILAFLLTLACLTPVLAADVSGSGTEDDPWLIGYPDAEAVTAYLSYGTLWVTGEGATMDFADEASLPWADDVRSIESLFIDSGVTAIGANAFRNIGTDVDYFDMYLGGDLAVIGASAFEGANLASPVIVTIWNPETVIGSRAFADSGLARIDFNEKPVSIADDAFAGLITDVYTVHDTGWTDDEKRSYGGKLTYRELFEVEVESIYEESVYEEMGWGGSSSSLVPEGESFTMDAADVMDCVFLRWELVEGDAVIDPDNSVIDFVPTGNVKLRLYLEYTGESQETEDDEDWYAELEASCPFAVTRNGAPAGFARFENIPERETDDLVGDYFWQPGQNLLLIIRDGLTVTMKESGEPIPGIISFYGENLSVTLQNVTLSGDETYITAIYPGSCLILKGSNSVVTTGEMALYGGEGLVITGSGSLFLSAPDGVAAMFAEEPSFSGVSAAATSETALTSALRNKGSRRDIAYNPMIYGYCTDDGLTPASMIITGSAGTAIYWAGGSAAVIGLALLAILRGRVRKANAAKDADR